MSIVDFPEISPLQSQLEQRLAQLEDASAAVLDPQAKSLLVRLLKGFAQAGENILCAGRPGPVACQVFRELAAYGVTVRVCPHQNATAFQEATDEHTAAIYCELLSAPADEPARLDLLNVLAETQQIPLLVDNFIATAAMGADILQVADIVVYSSLAFLSDGNLPEAGAFIDRGTSRGLLRTSNPRSQDASLSATTSADIECATHGRVAFFGQPRVPESAFNVSELSALERGLDSLTERMELCCKHAQQLAELLAQHPLVSCVNAGGDIEKITAQKAPFVSLGLRLNQAALRELVVRLRAQGYDGPVGGQGYNLRHSVSEAYKDCTEQERVTAMAADNVICIFAGTSSYEPFYEALLVELEYAQSHA